MLNDGDECLISIGVSLVLASVFTFLSKFL
jgi:hypothetical protein